MRTAQMDKPTDVKDRSRDPKISHIFYCGRPRLMRGDRALCGFVHETDGPGHLDVPAGNQHCVVCWDLDR